MAFVKVFCFWFSVRLGSIIIAIFTLIQCIVCLTYGLIWMDAASNSDSLGLDETQFALNEKTIKDIVKDSEEYVIGFSVFFGTLSFSCILLIIGSFICSAILLYPFIISYFMYVAMLTVAHIYLMMNFKKEDFGIGVLILYSSGGGFLILYLLYLWICVVSFVQIIHELRKEIKAKNLILDVQKANRIMIANSKLEKAYLN